MLSASAPLWRVLLGGCILLALICSSVAVHFSRTQRAEALAAQLPLERVPHFELAARASLPHGFIREAAWLDNDNYLALMLSPDGAAVWRVGYSNLDRQKFMSSGFIEQNICPAAAASRLNWTVSPGRRYIAFLWFNDDGTRQCTVVDIAGAPEFKLKRFTPPAGMQISRVLFSPDDKYAVFVHDAFHEGCEVSLLVLDLKAGVEAWRVSNHDLSFINELWWGGAILDAPKFNAVAGLYDGQFHERPGLAVCDIQAKTVTFNMPEDGPLTGAQALWGKAVCYAATDTAAGAPFSLVPTVPGQNKLNGIALSSKPVQIQALPAPGLILVVNTLDNITNELWLVNVLNSEKYLVDDDCAAFNLSADNKLLVRSQSKSEIKLYEFVIPDTGAK